VTAELREVRTLWWQLVRRARLWRWPRHRTRREGLLVCEGSRGREGCRGDAFRVEPGRAVGRSFVERVSARQCDSYDVTAAKPGLHERFYPVRFEYLRRDTITLKGDFPCGYVFSTTRYSVGLLNSRIPTERYDFISQIIISSKLRLKQCGYVTNFYK